jgi:hypothetical protein
VEEGPAHRSEDHAAEAASAVGADDHQRRVGGGFDQRGGRMHAEHPLTELDVGEALPPAGEPLTEQGGLPVRSREVVGEVDPLRVGCSQVTTPRRAAAAGTDPIATRLAESAARRERPVRAASTT